MKNVTALKYAISAIGCAILSTTAAPALAASDAEVELLEARVAELEAMVRSMMSANGTPPAPAAPVPVVARASSEPDDAEHSYKFGGYIKADAMLSDYSSGDLAAGSIGTSFYVPATIPVGDDSAGEGPDADFQARETRLNFRSDHGLSNGDQLMTFIEMDFMVNAGGNERISNSANARLRHAFFKYNNWLFGQTWTTFQDVAALPENLDFIGPSEGTTFGRQAMIRYTNGAWEFALENPETTITPFGGGGRIVTDDGGIPDVAVRYTAKLDNGYIKAAGLLRQLSYESGAIDDDELGYGLSVSGKHMLGRNDIRWMATAGTGIGRYLGLNTSNGAVLNAAGNLEAIDQVAGFVSYRHFWESTWHSNFTLSYLSIDNDTSLTGTAVTKDVYSAHFNLLYEPVPKMLVGGEIIYASREIESGLDGSMTRFMFSARYGF